MNKGPVLLSITQVYPGKIFLQLSDLSLALPCTPIDGEIWHPKSWIPGLDTTHNTTRDTRGQFYGLKFILKQLSVIGLGHDSG